MSDEEEKRHAAKFGVGDRVWVHKLSEGQTFNAGTLRYIGNLLTDPRQNWFGVELDCNDAGKHDGELTHQGGIKKRYFKTLRPKTGILCRPKNVIHVAKHFKFLSVDDIKEPLETANKNAEKLKVAYTENSKLRKKADDEKKRADEHATELVELKRSLKTAMGAHHPGRKPISPKSSETTSAKSPSSSKPSSPRVKDFASNPDFKAMKARLEKKESTLSKREADVEKSRKLLEQRAQKVASLEQEKKTLTEREKALEKKEIALRKEQERMKTELEKKQTDLKTKTNGLRSKDASLTEKGKQLSALETRLKKDQKAFEIQKRKHKQEAEAQLANLTNRERDLKLQLSDLEKEKKAVQRRKSFTEKEYSELKRAISNDEKAGVRIKTLEIELKDARAQLAKEKEGAARLESEHKSLLTKTELLEKKNQSIDREMDKIKKRNQKLERLVNDEKIRDTLRNGENFEGEGDDSLQDEADLSTSAARRKEDDECRPDDALATDEQGAIASPDIGGCENTNDQDYEDDDGGVIIDGTRPSGRSRDSKTDEKVMQVLKDMKDVPRNVIELKSQVKTAIVLFILLTCFFIAHMVSTPPEVLPYV